MGVIAGFVLGAARVIGGLLLLALRFALPILLGAGLVALLRRRPPAAGGKRPRSARKPHFHGPVYTVDYRETPEEPDLSAAPDGPEPFGYKTAWLAVKCGRPESVMDAMGLEERTPANWKAGLAAAHGESSRVFVSPVLDGYVLVIGLPGPMAEEDGWLAALAGAFPEVQRFATHRVTEYHSWERYVSGRPIRNYRYAGERGAVLRDWGDWTPEEIALGFGRFPRAGRENDWEGVPNEEDVLDIAAAWGVDPRFSETACPPSTGWICKIKEVLL